MKKQNRSLEIGLKWKKGLLSSWVHTDVLNAVSKTMKTTKETETPCNVIASMKMSRVFFFFFVIKDSFTLGYLGL